VLYRIGAALPSPGVNFPHVQQCIKEASGGEAGQIYSLINLFSGGALLKLTVFAVGVMPYNHRQHHRAAAHGGHSTLRGTAQRGPVRPGQDDAVQPATMAIALAVLQATSIVALAANGGMLHRAARWRSSPIRASSL